jgi:hypothetical protein
MKASSINYPEVEHSVFGIISHYLQLFASPVENGVSVSCMQGTQKWELRLAE